MEGRSGRVAISEGRTFSPLSGGSPSPQVQALVESQPRGELPPKAVPPSPKTSASASGASYRLCGVQTWGVLRFERPRTRVLRAQTGCFRSLYGSPGARFLTPGDTGAESWAEAFGAVLSEAGSLDGTPDAEQSVDRGLPPDDP